jgi:hypothetical protein
MCVNVYVYVQPHTYTRAYTYIYLDVHACAYLHAHLNWHAQAIIDSYLCIVHLTTGVVVEALFNAFATAAFFKFMIFSIFEMRYLLIIWKARRPQVRRWMCHAQTYCIWKCTCILSQKFLIYIYIYIHTHTYIHMSTHTYTHICIHTHTYTYVCTWCVDYFWCGVFWACAPPTYTSIRVRAYTQKHFTHLHAYTNAPQAGVWLACKYACSRADTHLCTCCRAFKTGGTPCGENCPCCTRAFTCACWGESFWFIRYPCVDVCMRQLTMNIYMHGCGQTADSCILACVFLILYFCSVWHNKKNQITRILKYQQVWAASLSFCALGACACIPVCICFYS